MLNEQELQVLCRRLKIPKAGREVLARIRTNLDQPVAFSRMPMMLAEPNERGLYPSAKMGRRFPFLLGADQLAILDHLEYDDEVLEYYPFPAPIIEAAGDQPGAQANKIRYPDYFVIRVHAVGWEDWLTIGETQENFVPALGFYYWEKHVTDIRPERRHMMRFLEPWLNETRSHQDEHIASAIREHVASHPGITLSTLCKEIAAASLNDVYPLIALGQVSVEFGIGGLEDPEQIACFPVASPKHVDLQLPKKRGVAPSDELGARLGKPDLHDARLEELRQNTLVTHDQRIQKAAMHDLVRLGGGEAVLILTERLLDLWGCGAIERAIRSLSRLAPDAGLLGLAATLLLDIRYYSEKLEGLAKGAAILGRSDVAEQVMRLKAIPWTWDKPIVRQTLVALEQLSLDDIACGATLARMLTNLPEWMRSQAPANAEFFDSLRLQAPLWPGEVAPINMLQRRDAVRSAQLRLPGLVELLGVDDLCRVQPRAKL